MRDEVDPGTGTIVGGDAAGDHYVLPRFAERRAYPITSSYLRGIELKYEAEEVVAGLSTYIYEYRGDVEYTFAYSGSPNFPGIQVAAGEEIRCRDAQFRAWVEPVTGEIVKVQESCRSGDYVHARASGRPLRPIAIWGGETTSSDVLTRATQISTGAHIAVESAVGKGTRFSMYFTPAVATVRAAEPKAPAVAAGHGTVLVVKDEPGVRWFAVSALVRSGYRVLEAASPGEARRMFELHRDAIDLVLTDLLMPGGTGAELASELKAASPDLGVLFMTGYARTALGGQNVVDGPIIEKPFSAAELSVRVQQAMRA